MPIENIYANILGFHNKDMFLDKLSFKVDCPIKNVKEQIQIALEKTIIRGKEISDMQKDIHHPLINSGSSKLPAAALFRIIESYTQKNKSLCIPLNRVLSDVEKEKFDITTNVGAQLFCQIVNNRIKTISTQLSNSDIFLLKRGIKNFTQELNYFSVIYKRFNLINRG